MLKPLCCGSNWGIVVFAVLLTKKRRGYVSRFQGQWSALKVLWPGLVHAVYGLKKMTFTCMKMLDLSLFNIFFARQFHFCLTFWDCFVLVVTFPGRYHQIFDTEVALCAFGDFCYCQYSLKLWIGINLYFWSHDIEVWHDTGLDQANWMVLGLNPAWVFLPGAFMFSLCQCVCFFFQFSLTVSIHACQID